MPVQLDLFPDELLLLPDTVPPLVVYLNDVLTSRGLHICANITPTYLGLGRYYLVDCITAEVRECDCDIRALASELGLAEAG